MQRMDLCGAWEMRDAASPRWIAARVPGSVIRDLMEAGELEDPFYRDNEDRARAAMDRDFEYRRTFSVSHKLLECACVVLRCEGLDTLAEVRLGDEVVLRADDMHRTYEVQIKESLRVGLNTIRILFRSSIRYIAEKQREKALFSPSHAMAGLSHIRKAHSMFGWDSDPQIPDAGIFRPIEILGFEAGRLGEARVRQEHHGAGVTLRVSVQTELFGADLPKGGRPPLSTEIALTPPQGGAAQIRCREAAAQETVCFEIPKPALWWPNGYGGQPLYEIRVRLLGAREVLEEKVLSVGLRCIRVRREPDEWGESFALEVNGLAIFAMGACYIPQDKFLSRCTRDKTERLLSSCVDAHFNCVRVWGGGVFPEDYFYELCDRMGLLVWQDLMFACATYNMDDSFLNNIREETRDNVLRIRHHACLALWCGNNELNVSLTNWNHAKTNQNRLDYIRVFEVLFPQWFREWDPDTFYWPSSPSSGMYFEDPKDPSRGDCHFWSVWHQAKPYSDYRNTFFRFTSEYGLQSFPDYKTIRSYTEPQERGPFSYIMEKHQKNQDGAGNAKILYYTLCDLPLPADTREVVYASQIVQAEAMRCGAEHWRRNRGRCMGALYWQLNDCWPGPTWSGMDYFGRWKALHYFAKRFFAPVLLSCEESGGIVTPFLLNETPRQASGRVEWRLSDPCGAAVARGAFKASAEPQSSTPLPPLELSHLLADPARRRALHLETRFKPDEGGAEDFAALLFVKPKHYALMEPSLRVTAEDRGDHFCISLRAEAFALYVQLDFDEADAVFSDNFFALPAGEEKQVRLMKERLSVSWGRDELLEALRVRSLFNLMRGEKEG